MRIEQLTYIDSLRPIVRSLLSDLTFRQRAVIFQEEVKASPCKSDLIANLFTLTRFPGYLCGGGTIPDWERTELSLAPLTLTIPTLQSLLEENCIPLEIAGQFALAHQYYYDRENGGLYRDKLKEWGYEPKEGEIDSHRAEKLRALWEENNGGQRKIMPYVPPTASLPLSFTYISFERLINLLRDSGLLKEFDRSLPKER